MPFCPNCKYEYKPEVHTCPDCNVRLLAELPVEEETEEVTYDDWIHVARMMSTVHSDMVVDALKSENIPVAAISGTGHFGATGQMGLSSFRDVGGGLSIMIPREYVSQADVVAEGILGEVWRTALLVEIDRQ